MANEEHDSAPSLFDQVDEPEEDPEIREKREELRRKVATRKLNNLQERVAYVLSQFPETRNSDITLQIKYWQTFQREKLSGGVVPLQELYDLERLTSIARARATIQNDYKLYLPTSGKVAKQRKQLEEEKREDYEPVDLDIPPVSVFSDESGKNQDFLIVGSVWVLMPSEEYRLFRETNEWREEKGVTHEMKFNKISKSNRDIYCDFINRFMVNEGVFGFKAIAMESKGISDEQAALSDLFYFLLRRGLEHEHSTGRAPLPRRLTFIKDFEEKGYDDRLMALTIERLETAAESVFDGDLAIESAYTEDSKGLMGLQIADLFTGCVNRVLNEPAPTKGWKDEFAEEALDAIGMEEVLDTTETFEDRAVRLSLRSRTMEGPLNEENGA